MEEYGNAQPNTSPGGQLPGDVVFADPQAVLDAYHAGKISEAEMIAYSIKMQNQQQQPEPDPVTPIDPYFLLAEKEAADDEVLGIIRSNEWIKKRSQEMAREDEKRKDNDPRRFVQDYFNINRIGELMEMGNKRELPPFAQHKFNQAVTICTAEAIKQFSATYTPEAIYQKKVDEEYKEKLDIEKKRLQEEHRTSMVHTLTFIKSGLFALAVPFLGFLPQPWNLLQMVPLFFIFKINYPALKKLHVILKEIDAEKKAKQQLKADAEEIERKKREEAAEDDPNHYPG